MVSKTQNFIDTHSISDDLDVGTINEISKEEFIEETKGLSLERFYKLRIETIEPEPHPLLKVVEKENTSTIHEDGFYMQELKLLFKYKSKYYEFYQYCDG